MIQLFFSKQNNEWQNCKFVRYDTVILLEKKKKKNWMNIYTDQLTEMPIISISCFPLNNSPIIYIYIYMIYYYYYYYETLRFSFN